MFEKEKPIISNKKLFVLFAITVLMLARSALATTYYVDGTNGDDEWDGLAAVWDGQHGPVATIQAGIDAAAIDSGDTVIVADGVYTGDGNRDIDFDGKAITLRSDNGPEKCIIDCQGSAEESHRGFFFHNNETSDAILQGFTIEEAQVNGSMRGAAIFCSSSPSIRDCNIRNNRDFCTNSTRSGVILCEGGSPTIKNCMLTQNFSKGNGGALHSYNGNVTVENCVMAQNHAQNGGAVYVKGTGTDSITLTNCTLVANIAIEGGGLYCEGPAAVTNCILWDNKAAAGKQVFIDSILPVADDPEITYCAVQGGASGLWDARVDPSGYFDLDTTNLSADPLFALDGDYHLTPGSPCIDAGNNNPTGGLPATDFEGSGRLVDGDDDQTATVDVGAYEYDDSSPCIAVSPGFVVFYAPWRGYTVSDKTLIIRNSAPGTLNWSISEDADWLAVSPASGQSTGEEDEVTLSVDTYGMDEGKYACELSITASSALNSPRTVIIRLIIGEQEPDDGSIVDIMFTYPYQLDESVSPEDCNAMLEQAEDFVVTANLAFQNSLIDFQFRLVFAGPIFDYDDAGSGLSQAKNPTDGYMDEVHVLRDIHGADFVAVGSGQGISMGEFHAGFSFVSTSSVWLHEVGHSLAQMSNYKDHNGGHTFTGNSGSGYSTNMYAMSGYLLHFSNPDVNYDGVPTGVEYVYDVPPRGTGGNYTGPKNNTAVMNFKAIGNANKRLSAIKRIIYVDKDVSGFNDGSSWQNAFTNLQDALGEYSDGKVGHLDEIWVASGTYNPDEGIGQTSGDRAATFALIEGVSLYGGFEGTEIALEQRDPNNITVLSGDIGVVTDPNDNSYHVVSGPEDSFRVLKGLAVLDGFTVTGGNADGSADEDKKGAGFYIASSSPAIRSCDIVDNTAETEGSAIYATDSDIEIVNMAYNSTRDEYRRSIQDAIEDSSNGDTIEVYPGTYYEKIDFLGKAVTVKSTDPQDWDIVAATVIHGGNDPNESGYPQSSGVIVRFDSGEDANSVLTGFTITGGHAADGAGIVALNSSPAISNCIFRDNYATEVGGAIMTLNSDLLISNCIFRDNYAAIDGGSVKFYYEKPVITNCIFTNNTAGSNGGALNLQTCEAIVANCIFESNTTETGSGGGLYNSSEGAVISNCTFFNNTAAGTGGGMCHSGGCQVTNSIFWQNSAFQSDQAGYFGPGFLAPTISYCDIQGSGGSGANWDTTVGIDGGDNIDAAPNFADAANDDFRIALASPCVDAGDPSGDYTNQTDFYGDARVLDGLVDIGADEMNWLVRNVTQNIGYDEIQPAIDAALDDDTITVQKGTFIEEIEIEDKSIVLESSDPTDPLIVAATIIKSLSSSYMDAVVFISDDNTSVLNGFTIEGGGCGVECDGSQGVCSPTISNCVIKDSLSFYGGIHCINSSALIVNCKLHGHMGPGVYSEGASPPEIRSNWIYDNLVGIWIHEATSQATIKNNTLVGNKDTVLDYGCGVGASDGTGEPPVIAPAITNCILWDNIDDLYQCSATYSCIEDGDSGAGNISSAPNFVDAANDDFHLKSQAGRWKTSDLQWVADTVTSPCIDAGDAASDWTNELWPHGKRINIGAYGGTAEASMSLDTSGNPADFDKDDDVDLTDFSSLVDNWFSNESLLAQDISRDNFVNLSDFAMFAGQWLWQEP